MGNANSPKIGNGVAALFTLGVGDMSMDVFGEQPVRAREPARARVLIAGDQSLTSRLDKIVERGIFFASSVIDAATNPSRTLRSIGLRAMMSALKPIGRRPPLGVVPVQYERGVFKRSLAMVTWPKIEIDLVQESTVEVDGGNIPVRIYNPAPAEAYLPVVVYYHGGGFMFGDLNDFDGFCRNLAAKTGAIIVSVEYRLAPEHKYPTAHMDGYKALLWVNEKVGEFGGDPGRIAIAGDSAGANIAAGISLMARDGGGPNIIFQLLMSPVTNVFDLNTPSLNKNDGLFISKKILRLFRDALFTREEDLAETLVSPYLAADHKDLPPAMVIVGSLDPLHDDGVRYAEKLQAAGVPVRLLEEPNGVHDFILFRGAQSEKVISLAVAILKRAFWPAR